jgi:hypothetical protein
MPPPNRGPLVHVSDQQIQALLTRHHCPTPLHVLRMRFLGAIASPRVEVSPIQLVTKAWGGELPEFASEDEAEELFQALLGGWWNRLSEYQNSRSPFRLPRSEVKPTRHALLDLAQTRSQELTVFVDGLFGDDEEMDMPEKAHEAQQWMSRNPSSWPHRISRQSKSKSVLLTTETLVSLFSHRTCDGMSKDTSSDQLRTTDPTI